MVFSGSALIDLFQSYIRACFDSDGAGPKERLKMAFNCGLLCGLRLKNGISRSDFAKLLGISYNHIHKIETGQREPSLDLLLTISRYTGVPVEAFLEDESSLERMDSPEKATNLIKLINDLNREKFTVKTLKNRVLELEKLRNHILAVNALQEKFITILKQDTSPVEKGKKTAILARSAIRAGEIRFDEVQAALRLSRKMLKQWLVSEKGEYRCKLFDDRNVSATTPMEAGIRLGCFDCQARADEDCRGYGENNYPENLIMLVAMLEANGISGREEQAQLMRESFDMEINAHQLSDAISKQKHGKPVPENLMNMRAYKRA
jgi:transcriptional regulator with XRE-family HTH domain